jgi:hypothetical protein
MVDGKLTQGAPMTAALKYLSRMTDQIFETQMQRAACKISARQHVFRRREG